MIEVQVKDIVNSTEIFSMLSQKKLNMRMAYQLAKIIKEVQKEFELFQETRMKLINEYAERDENGQLKVDENNNFTIPKEKIQDFQKELNDLLEMQVELPINEINLEELKNIEFTPMELIKIEKFINIGQE